MARYAHIENNEITGVYDFLPENWRNISNFRALDNETELLTSLGWRTIVKNPPNYNPVTQYMGNPKYTLVNDVVFEDVEIFNVPVVVAQAYESGPTVVIDNNSLHIMAVQQLREKRDQLLKETDFTQLIDVSKINGAEITAAYETYRQQLRDLPSQYENDDSFIDFGTVIFPSLVIPTPIEETPTDNSGV